MAGALRVYRRFYHIGIAIDHSASYTLIDPTSLSATVRNVTLGNLIVEADATIVQDSTGLYYADLTSSLYNSSYEYEVQWTVKYIPVAPTTAVYTRFRFPLNAGTTSGLIIRELDVVMDNQLPLELSIESRTLDYVIEATP